LIATFRLTLETLTNNQHENGTIPSNVMTNEDVVEVSYGGWAELMLPGLLLGFVNMLLYK
jgi:hypothetical protein